MGFTTVEYKVIVAGQDVTSRFDPLLLSVKVTRASGKAADECDLELSDADGAIVLPKPRAPVMVLIEGQRAFSGFVSDIDYRFSKGSGRTLTLSASSIDQGSKVKEPAMRHKDDATLEDVAKEWGQKAGLTVKVAGSIKALKRDYWLSQNESFMGWAQRISNEVGASLKILGNEAYIIAINEGISPTGKTLSPITAEYGVNLLSGSISPIISRPKFKSVKISYFDIAKGMKVETDVPSGIEDVDAALRTVITSADESQAKQKGGAIGKQSDREKGGGSISIIGNVFAEPEAIVKLTGVRPGIDGEYRIASVDHSLSRSGFTTDLSLKQPQGGAGVDSR